MFNHVQPRSTMMRRTLSVAILLVLIALVLIYIIIPNQLHINKVRVISSNKEALYRKLSATDSWTEWWPGKQQRNDDGSYSLNSINYTALPIQYTSIPVKLQSKSMEVPVEMILLPVKLDSTRITIQAAIPTSYNPFKRVARYFQVRRINKNFDDIVEALSTRFTSIQNLYGYDIQKKSVVDSTLIFTSATLNARPSIDTIYAMVDRLRAHIQKHNAKETNPPMLNIYTTDNIHYLVKVAIPVDKILPDTDNIQYKWMLGGGNILITEVKGGWHEIQKAFDQVHHYVQDFNRVAPAIPFESMVTDRRNEPDTNKWVTRIYYPVM